MIKRPFSKKLYETYDNAAKEKLIKFLSNNGHTILSDKEDYNADVVSEKDGITKVLSNPRVFTLDGEEAVIIQGEEIPYKTEAEGGGTDIQFKEAGVKLTVLPTIVGDGNIILSVKVEKKTAKNDEANPPITTREITTKLLIRDDTIVVIGAL